MVEEFLSGLTKTNKSHLYFVNWKKARKYQEVFKDELALLQVLNREDVDAKKELVRLLETYPRINCLLPLLLAIRIKPKGGRASLTVLDDNKIESIEYNFREEKLTREDINKNVEFVEKTGLLNELRNIKNHSDYYFGIEVGLDTNARKNRSGSAMELIAEEFIRKAVNSLGGEYLKQKTFKIAADTFKVKVPEHLENKIGDFLLLVSGKPINIETNYFDDGGSKQEIMNSYLPRAENLKKAGWDFILVTDGKGWLSNGRQIEDCFNQSLKILNLKMCAEGILERKIAEIARQ